MRADDDFRGKRTQEFGVGRDREPDTGVFFTNNRKSKRGHPDFRGELKIDLKFLNELVEEGGVLKIAGWKKNTKAGPLIRIRVQRWKPGDPVRGDKEDDNFEVPE